MIVSVFSNKSNSLLKIVDWKKSKSLLVPMYGDHLCIKYIKFEDGNFCEFVYIILL